MITVLIPIAPHETIGQHTIRSIAEQDCDAKWIALTTPIDTKDREPLRAKRRNEITNRNLLLQLASEPYACYCDSDVMFATPHDISDCCKFLEDNQDYDAVALNTKQGIDIAHAERIRHVCCACMVIRTARWRGYQWRSDADACGCIDVNRTFRIRYLDARQLVEKSAG